jgi:hypothetical protein
MLHGFEPFFARSTVSHFFCAKDKKASVEDFSIGGVRYCECRFVVDICHCLLLLVSAYDKPKGTEDKGHVPDGIYLTIMSHTGICLFLISLNIVIVIRSRELGAT